MGEHKLRLAEWALAVSYLLSQNTALVLYFFLELHQAQAHPYWKFCLRSYTAVNQGILKKNNPNQQNQTKPQKGKLPQYITPL